jgi:hypothetical protein
MLSTNHGHTPWKWGFFLLKSYFWMYFGMPYYELPLKNKSPTKDRAFVNVKSPKAGVQSQ